MFFGKGGVCGFLQGMGVRCGFLLLYQIFAAVVRICLYLRGNGFSLNAIVKGHDKGHCAFYFVLEYNCISEIDKGTREHKYYRKTKGTP